MERRMECIQSDSVRGLVEKVNAAKVRKEDIVQVMHLPGQYVVLYYKDGDGNRQ